VRLGLRLRLCSALLLCYDQQYPLRFSFDLGSILYRVSRAQSVAMDLVRVVGFEDVVGFFMPTDRTTLLMYLYQMRDNVLAPF